MKILVLAFSLFAFGAVAQGASERYRCADPLDRRVVEIDLGVPAARVLDGRQVTELRFIGREDGVFEFAHRAARLNVLFELWPRAKRGPGLVQLGDAYGNVPMWCESLDR